MNLIEVIKNLPFDREMLHDLLDAILNVVEKHRGKSEEQKEVLQVTPTPAHSTTCNFIFINTNDTIANLSQMCYDFLPTCRVCPGFTICTAIDSNAYIVIFCSKLDIKNLILVMWYYSKPHKMAKNL